MAQTRQLYRKLKRGKLWHWVRSCSRWPQVYGDDGCAMIGSWQYAKSEVEQRVLARKPTTGRLCQSCKKKEAAVKV